LELVKNKIITSSFSDITIIFPKPLFSAFQKIHRIRLGQHFIDALSVRLNQVIQTSINSDWDLERVLFGTTYNTNIGFNSIINYLSDKKNHSGLKNGFDTLLDKNSFKPLIFNDTDKEKLHIIKVSTCLHIFDSASFDNEIRPEPLYYFVEHLDSNITKQLKNKRKCLGLSFKDENIYSDKILSIYENLSTHHQSSVNIESINNLDSLIEAIFPKLSLHIKEKLKNNSGANYVFIKSSDLYIKEKSIEYFQGILNKQFSIKPYFDLEDEKLGDYLFVEDFGKLPEKKQSKFWNLFKIKQFHKGFVVFIGEALPTYGNINQELQHGDIFTIDEKLIKNNLTRIIYNIVNEIQQTKINYLTAYHISRNKYKFLFRPRLHLFPKGFYYSKNSLGILRKVLVNTCSKISFDFNSPTSWYVFFNDLNSLLKYSTTEEHITPLEARYVSFEFNKTDKTWYINNIGEEPIFAQPSTNTMLFIIFTIMYYNKNHKPINHSTLYDYYNKYAPEYRKTRKNKTKDKSTPSQIISSAFNSLHNLHKDLREFVTSAIDKPDGRVGFLPISEEKGIEYKCEIFGMDVDKNIFSNKLEQTDPQIND